MKNRMKHLLFALMLTFSMGLILTGCDQLKKQPETETETETETEKQTETETEKQTEKQTETETETEKQTETETEKQTEPRILTVAEEKAEEVEFDQLRTMYAIDDVNVRVEPGTGDDAYIFHSFYQGDSMIVTGETPNWYKVDVEEYDDPGYVSKKFVSEQKVDPKTEDERMKLIEEEAEAAASSNEVTGTDMEFDVQAYAESFPIVALQGANLRLEPDQAGEIIGTVASGTTVKALGYTDKWYKIDFDGTIGYVNQNLFSAE